ncbi:GGDEF domain-containing protein [Nocardioides sp. SYSU DS0651]|uniref:GGDEF domain-containing protein n=1 Tax=Nocardioides sp. SYSU DS0651 TaxID=3415955 RepID=UPI003F4B5EDC
MLDTPTLRVAFGLVAICVLVLFYGVTYRSTRAAYSGWWCLSLAAFLFGALLYLFNGTALQVVANPMGNGIAVLGSALVWAGARSLRGRGVSAPQLALVPVVVVVAALLDDPVHDVWTGGAVFLVGMALCIGLSAHELQALLREQRPWTVERAQFRFAVLSMAFASGGLAVFYLLRAAVFVAVGPEHLLFRTAFGSQVTTILTMLLLVVVTFSMSAFSHEQQTSELRVRATRDGLTGVLNRGEFLAAAQREADHVASRVTAAVMVADLDRFKALNDGYGHAAGDRALTAFADACRDVVGHDGIVGRLGGDEFVLMTVGAEPELVAAEISRRYHQVAAGAPHPTVSFGIAAVEPGAEVSEVVTHADAALYRAKAAGRDRAVRYDAAAPVPAPTRRTA